MIIDCISDLHGHYPELEVGDLLIVSGDLTARDDNKGWTAFELWLCEQKYKKKIFIAGNHDNKLQDGSWDIVGDGNTEYLCDSGTEFEGLKIWGSPWTRSFKGMNPRCKAFTLDTEQELLEKFKLIPHDTDILITHSPPYGILDECAQGDRIMSVGSTALRDELDRIKPLYHIFGHIHEGYGKVLLKHTGPNTMCINASHVDERYRPVNKTVRIEI